MTDWDHLDNIRAALQKATAFELVEHLRLPFPVGDVRCAIQQAGDAAREAIATINGAPLAFDDDGVRRLALMAEHSRSSSELVRALRLWSCYRVLRMVDPPSPEYPL